MEEEDLPLEPCTLDGCLGQVVMCSGMYCLHDLRLCFLWQVRVGGACAEAAEFQGQQDAFGKCVRSQFDGR